MSVYPPPVTTMLHVTTLMVLMNAHVMMDSLETEQNATTSMNVPMVMIHMVAMIMQHAQTMMVHMNVLVMMDILGMDSIVQVSINILS